MSGATLQILPRTMIDFTDIAPGAIQLIWLAQRIPCEAWREGTFYVRLHPGTSITVAPSTLSFLVCADGHTTEDPASTDPNATLVGFQPLLVATSLLGVAPGDLVRVAVPANAGSMLAVAVSIKQADAPGTVRLMTSVDLSVKS